MDHLSITRIPPLLAIALLASIPFGEGGGLAALTVVTLLFAYLVVKKAAKVYRAAAVAVPFFLFGYYMAFFTGELDSTAVVVPILIGYLAIGFLGASLVRLRAKKVEPEAILEGISVGATIGLVLWTFQEVHQDAASQYFYEVAISAVFIASLIALIGRSQSRGVLYTVLALGASVVAEVLDSTPLFAPYLYHLWTVPYLVMVQAVVAGHLVAPAASAVAARRRFGLLQLCITQIWLFAPLISIYLVVELGSSGLPLKMVLAGLVVVFTAALRLWLLVRLRDWSYGQERKLRAYGDQLLTLENQAQMGCVTVSVLERLVGGKGSVALIDVYDGMPVVRNEFSAGASRRKRRRVVHFGERTSATEDWFESQQTNGSTIQVAVPNNSTETYMVAALPYIARHDLVNHFGAVAAQYALAVRAHELAEIVHNQRADRRFRSLVQDSNDLIFLIESTGYTVKTIGPTLHKMLGYDDATYLDRSFIQHMDPRDRTAAHLTIDRNQNYGDVHDCDVRLLHKDGSLRWFAMTVRDLSDEEDLDGLLISFSDIHDRKVADGLVRQSQKRYRAMIENSSDVFMLLTEEKQVTFVSPNVVSVFEQSPEDLIGSSIRGLFPVSAMVDLDAAAERLHDSASETFEVQFEGEGPQDTRHIRATISCLEAAQEQGYALTLSDVTSTRELENSLRSRAIYDEVTGLLNRPSLVHEMNTELQSLNKGECVGLIELDIRDFRAINDIAGFVAGDQLLAEVASRLRSTLRGNDHLARLVHDEFAVVVVASNSEAIMLAAERLVGVFDQSFTVSEHSFDIEVRLGITETSDRQSNAHRLLQQAAVALHAAKQDDHSNIMVFEQSMQDKAEERFELTASLRDAVEQDDFYVVYQPLVELHSKRVHGFEALMRWNHPVRGNVPPNVFIKLAEDSGAIIEMGRWVLRRACQQLVDWQELHDGFDDASMSVNLSARQLEQPDELERLHQIIVDSGIRMSRLKLELTETVMVKDACGLSEQLQEIQSWGVGIAIDDFGTGANNLNHLRSLPFDILKIDKSYIDRVDINDPEGSQLVGKIIDLAKGFHASTVAEGIESPDQIDELKLLGCDIGQGFFLARPMEAPTVHEWVDSWNSGSLVDAQ